LQKKKETKIQSDDPETREHTVTLQAGLRTLHEKGPELKRAISGNLDEMVEIYDKENEDDTTHRRNIPFFGNMIGEHLMNTCAARATIFFWGIKRGDSSWISFENAPKGSYQREV